MRKSLFNEGIGQDGVYRTLFNYRTLNRQLETRQMQLILSVNNNLSLFTCLFSNHIRCLFSVLLLLLLLMIDLLLLLLLWALQWLDGDLLLLLTFAYLLYFLLDVISNLKNACGAFLNIIIWVYYYWVWSWFLIFCFEYILLRNWRLLLENNRVTIGLNWNWLVSLVGFLILFLFLFILSNLFSLLNVFILFLWKSFLANLAFVPFFLSLNKIFEGEFSFSYHFLNIHVIIDLVNWCVIFIRFDNNFNSLINTLIHPLFFLSSWIRLSTDAFIIQHLLIYFCNIGFINSFARAWNGLKLFFINRHNAFPQ